MTDQDPTSEIQNAERAGQLSPRQSPTMPGNSLGRTDHVQESSERAGQAHVIPDPLLQPHNAHSTAEENQKIRRDHPFISLEMGREREPQNAVLSTYAEQRQNNCDPDCISASDTLPNGNALDLGDITQDTLPDFNPGETIPSLHTVAEEEDKLVTASNLPCHNKSTKFNVFSAQRPHMRAFHYSWITCVSCFVAWFAISPLLSTLKKPKCADPQSDLCLIECVVSIKHNATYLAHDKHCAPCFPNDRDYGCGGLGLTEDQVFTSNAIGVAGTFFLRLFGGPIIDSIGAKWFQVGIMVFSLWCLFWLPFVETYEELVAARFFISFLGASFVGTAAWCSVMFDKSVIGLVSATASGWGKVGAGVTYLVIPLIYKSFKDSGFDNDYAWRHTLLIPPSIVFFAMITTISFSDSSPDSDKFLNNKDVEARGAIQNHKQAANKAPLYASFGAAAMNYRTWVMSILFFCSNGVDICMGNVVAYYFVKEFHMHQSEASLAGSSFGLMNLFARSLGGLLSDKLYLRFGLFGRAVATWGCTLGMGIGLVVFTSIGNENGGLLVAILVLMITSVFTQAAQGACYGIVPAIDPRYVGAVSGLVGAGGNVGAIVFNLLMAVGFRTAWTIIGYGCIVCSFLVFFAAMPDENSRKILKESLRKHSRMLFASSRNRELQPGECESIQTLVKILAKKEEELLHMKQMLAKKEEELSKREEDIQRLCSLLPTSSRPYFTPSHRRSGSPKMDMTARRSFAQVSKHSENRQRFLSSVRQLEWTDPSRLSPAAQSEEPVVGPQSSEQLPAPSAGLSALQTP